MSQKTVRVLSASIFACLIGIVFFLVPTPCEGQELTITTVAGGGTNYSGDLGDGSRATDFKFLFSLYSIALDAGGNLYIADSYNQRIRKVSTAGIITTAAGSGFFPSFSGDGGPATSAMFNFPDYIATDAVGNLYISDVANNRIRKVTLDGKINTIAGGGTGCAAQTDSLGDGCPATSAKLNEPRGLSLDAVGNLYIVDYFSNRIRKVSTAGIITTVAGTGAPGSSSGDGGPATSARLSFHSYVLADAVGNLYFADSQYFIRKVSTTGIITTVVGNGKCTPGKDAGPAGCALGDGGLAINAYLESPRFGTRCCRQSLYLGCG